MTNALEERIRILGDIESIKKLRPPFSSP